MGEKGDILKKAGKAIAANFEKGAGPYAGFERETEFFAQLADRLLVMMPPLEGARVLDVGCGTGASTRRVADAVGPEGGVVGIDISPAMLQQARRALGPAVTLACADGCSFADCIQGEFDAVTYNAVLFMLPDAAASLNCAARVLKPGGVVALSNLDGIMVGGEPAADLLERMGYRAGRHALSPWAKVAAALTDSFTGLVERDVELTLTPELFSAFYSQRPMSAGLMPQTPFEERVKAVDGVRLHMLENSLTATQRWKLAVAQKRIQPAG